MADPIDEKKFDDLDENLNMDMPSENEEAAFDDDLNDDGWDDDSIFNDPEDQDIPLSNEFSSTPQKTQVNWFNIGIIGGVVLALGGIGYMYLPSLLSPARPIPVATEQQSTPLAEAPTSPPSLEEEIAGAGGLLDNPELLAVDETTTNQGTADDGGDIFAAIDAPSSPSPAGDSDLNDLFADDGTQTSGDTIPNSPPAEQPRQPLPEAMDSIAENSPLLAPETEEVMDIDIPDVAEDIPDLAAKTPAAKETEQKQDEGTPFSITEAPSLVSAEVVEVDEEPAPTLVRDEALQDMNARLNDLSKQVTAVMQQLAAQQTKEEQTDTVAALEGQIADLEKRLNDLSKLQSAAPKETPKKAEPTPAPQPKKVESAPKVEKTAAAPKPAPAPKKVAAQPAKSWELRGASPGQAYIIEKGTENLRTVSVGETVPGIGKITSIAIEGNQWVVRGTQGTVTR